jgi:translation initiation factor 2 alpha subunit (eIF-2alpha)
METYKELLDSKLKLFTSKYNELNKVIEDNITLLKKLEGAIELLQVLLKELQAEINTKENGN